MSGALARLRKSAAAYLRFAPLWTFTVRLARKLLQRSANARRAARVLIAGRDHELLRASRFPLAHAWLEWDECWQADPVDLERITELLAQISSHQRLRWMAGSIPPLHL